MFLKIYIIEFLGPDSIYLTICIARTGQVNNPYYHFSDIFLFKMCVNKLPLASKKGEENQLRQIIGIACTKRPGYAMSLLLFLLITERATKKSFWTLCMYVCMSCTLCMHMCVALWLLQWGHIHTEESGWLWVFTLSCPPYGHKTGQRNLIKLGRPKLVVSPKGISFLSSALFFSPMAIPVDIIQYISHVIFCLQMEPNFSYPYLTSSLCWFMVDHPANRAFHPINQRFSASLNLQGRSSVHRAKVKILC